MEKEELELENKPEGGEKERPQAPDSHHQPVLTGTSKPGENSLCPDL